MKIRVHYWAKPIPTGVFDWEAVDDDYEPGDPIGYGSTKQAAIDDLMEQINDTLDEKPHSSH